jgi:hypothetical protein
MARVFLAACILLSAIIFSVASPSTTPVFFWSNTNYFLGRNEQIVDIISLQSLKTGLMQPQSSEAALLKINGKAAAPELIVVFIEPELKTEQTSFLAEAYQDQPSGGVFANLKKFVETSKSSVVAPYASSHSDSIGTQLALDILEHLSKESQIFVASDSDKQLETSRQVTKLTLKQLNEKLNQKWEVVSNGVTDLLVVYLDQTHEVNDALVNTVCSGLKGAEYVAIYTGDQPTRAVMKRFPVEHATLADFEEVNKQLYAIHDGNGPKWPDATLSGVVIIAPFVLILMIGICCTSSVQTPQKMDAERSKKLL